MKCLSGEKMWTLVLPVTEHICAPVIPYNTARFNSSIVIPCGKKLARDPPYEPNIRLDFPPAPGPEAAVTYLGGRRRHQAERTDRMKSVD
jgi:hypothetical protein